MQAYSITNISGGNIMATAYTVAERVADLIKQDIPGSCETNK
jgi:hypothetical protein